MTRRTIIAILAGAILATAGSIGYSAVTPGAAPRPVAPAHRAATPDPLSALITLWHKAPHTTHNSDGSVISDPAGKELVSECLDDSSLSHQELIACIMQPAN